MYYRRTPFIRTAAKVSSYQLQVNSIKAQIQQAQALLKLAHNMAEELPTYDQIRPRVWVDTKNKYDILEGIVEGDQSLQKVVDYLDDLGKLRY